MNFIWPWALAGLALVPLLIWLYVRSLPRPAQSAVAHSDVLLLARAAQQPRSWRRHLPAVLYLLAVTLALVALARPTARVPLPDNRTTIMLSMDVSFSMRATDVTPNRLEAAQAAAQQFVRSLPADARVGLVSFAGYAVLNAPPTSNHESILQAIQDLQLARRTGIGEGLLEALRALPGRSDEDTGAVSGDAPPAAIVLLSDGRNNTGADPLEAAALAARQSVKVYTVGLGTNDSNEGSFSFGGWGGFDAETLMSIAEVTGGRYYEASTASELNSIYSQLGRSLGWTLERREISGFLAALAGLTLIVSIAASERLTRRLL